VTDLVSFNQCDDLNRVTTIADARHGVPSVCQAGLLMPPHPRPLPRSGGEGQRGASRGAWATGLRTRLGERV
jgi:hypothetical protein